MIQKVGIAGATFNTHKSIKAIKHKTKYPIGY